MQGLRTTRAYSTLTSLPARGPVTSMVSVILPLARTNMILNPLLKNNSTGWSTFNSGVVSGNAGDYYHSGYGASIQPSGAGVQFGIYYLTSTLVAGTTYAASVKVKVIQPMQGAATYAIAVATTGAADLAVYRFKATGRWQWIWILWNETTNAARRIYIRRDDLGGVAAGSAADQFVISGLQLESCADGVLAPTTYIDGDQQGLLVGQQPPAYGWNGLPHASTSYRSALTRAGGYLVNLSSYNFLLTALIGLGMAAPNNVSIPYTVLDGARYLRTIKPPRTLSLLGRFQADDWVAYQQSQSAMRAALDRDLVIPQQPLKLVVEPQDDCGTVVGDFAQVQCLYAGGLEGDDGNLPEADVAPTFTLYLPYIVGGDSGGNLGVQQSVANANRILQRAPSGVWAALSTGASTNDVLCLARGLDGKIYIGGRFAQLGAVANTAGIGYWDPADGAFHAMGTGVTTGTVLVNALAVAPDGTVTAGGDFSTMGGVANTLRLAKWSGSTWSALSTGVNGQVRALAFGPTGTLYLGGAFTNAGGVAAADSIAAWSGAAFTALGTGSVGAVNALAIAPNGTLYAGGVFTSMGGVAGADVVAAWNGTTWAAMGGAWAGGGPTQANALTVGPSGIVYAGGDFTTAGGVAATRIAAWNGTAWSPMGTGMNLTVYSLEVRGDGAILAGGSFTTVSGIAYPDGFAVWTGSVWTPADVNLPGTATVFAILSAPDGTLYVGYDTAGSAISGAITALTNPAFGATGIGAVYPTLIITGPTTGTSRIFQLINVTTGIGVFFNYTINAGEVATLIFNPTNPSYLSTFAGSIQNTILPGSQPSLLALMPGANNISFYAADSTVTAALFWQKRYNGLADLVN